jgi:hypothetical protein
VRKAAGGKLQAASKEAMSNEQKTNSWKDFK